MSISAHSAEVDFFREPENGRKHQSPSCLLSWVSVQHSAFLYLMDRCGQKHFCLNFRCRRSSTGSGTIYLRSLVSFIPLPITCFHIWYWFGESFGMNTSHLEHFLRCGGTRGVKLASVCRKLRWLPWAVTNMFASLVEKRWVTSVSG